MKGSHIILIDDDEDERYLFVHVLTEIDRTITCECAINGAEGLQLLRTLEIVPDVIFLDLNMPKVNGKECLKEIRAMDRYVDVPVIIYSNSIIKEEIEEVVRLGASEFITKQLSFSKTKEAIRGVLDRIERIQSRSRKG